MTYSSRFLNPVCMSQRTGELRRNRCGHAPSESEVRQEASLAAKLETRFHRIARPEFAQVTNALALAAIEKREKRVGYSKNGLNLDPGGSQADWLNSRYTVFVVAGTRLRHTVLQTNSEGPSS